MKNLCMFSLLVMFCCGCEERLQTSDEVQRQQSERILAEGTAQVGMPAITNFRERKMMKDIIELRDQDGLVTYTYLENLTPQVVPGHTALGGKYTFLGQTVGYGIPYATQFTNPQKIQESHHQKGYAILPQAEPNGLFSPPSADATWILMKDPKGKDVKAALIEPKISVFAFKLASA